MRAALRNVILLLASLAAVLTVSPPVVRVWEYQAEGEAFAAVSLRQRLTPTPLVQEADLDMDGRVECLRLQEGRVVLLRSACDAPVDGEIVWESPEGWTVMRAALADLNHDDMPEASLLVWRDFKAWFIDQYIPSPGRINDFHNAENQSCHVILIGWKRDHFGEVWAGSAMVDPLLDISPADVNGDGRDELVALEARYTDAVGQPARALTAWEWNGFGFTILARQEGTFRTMRVLEDDNGRGYVLTGR